MADYIARQCANILELIDSSDEENVIIVLPPLPEPPGNEDDYDYNELRILHPVFGIIQRIEHVKIINYIENIVRSYNNIDFIMHFRISREIAYELIAKFSMCEVFTSLQDNAGLPKITAEKHILSYLWFVGHESASYCDVANRFGVTRSALHKIITRVTDFMSMAPDIITYPTIAEKEETATCYYEKKAFLE